MMTQYGVGSYDSLAVCNDNSTYNYFHRPGVGSSSNTWIIYFDGGHWCTDQYSCNVRYGSNPGLMSSRNQPKTLLHNYGITSPAQSNNPYWWGANHVYMPYCTSDVFRGGSYCTMMQLFFEVSLLARFLQTRITSTWQFRGKRSVAATIKALLATQNLKAATDILLVGSSAGGPGITGSAGEIYQQLLAAGANPTRFKLFSDGGWFIDLPEFNGGTGATYQSDAKALMSYTKATFDSQCMLNYPDAAWKCMLPQYNWPFLPAPLINHEYLYDLGNLAEDNAQPQDYETFRSLMTQTFNLSGNSVQTANLTKSANATAFSLLSSRTTAVTANKPQPYNATTFPGGVGGAIGYKPTIANQLASPLNIFAEACLLHTTVDSPLFVASDVNGVNFNDALWQWFQYDQFLVQEIDGYAGQRSQASCSQPPAMLTLAGR
ncbi:hypothetical protein WJX84_006449 [Apatococcus fuscideae]|uniref:Pectin acetylesterase n=1 Tax=Apatococcus fuscideae TaxID=2026836 RepID=A0AAW1SUU2_9CHLO